MDMSRRRVVIIGHGYTSRLALIRSLGKAGYEVYVILMVYHGRIGRFMRFEGGRPVDCFSKYVDRFFYCGARDEVQLLHLLLEKCSVPNQRVIIFPDSDFSACFVDSHKEALEGSFLFPGILGNDKSVSYWMMKSVQKSLAVKCGLSVAKGEVVSIRGGEFTISDTVTYPCFTKPLATVNGGKQYLKKCSSREQLCSLLSSVAVNGDADVLVEDFRQIEKEFAVVGISTGKEVIIPGVIEFISNSQSHFGIAREGLIKPLTGFEEIIRKFQQYVEEMGFVGLFDIDFYQSESLLYFGEMNLRYGGSGYAYTAMGVNLPLLMARSLCGEDISELKQTIDGTASYINERMCLDDWDFHYLTTSQYKSVINDAQIRFIEDKDDKGPQRRFNSYFRLHGIKRFIRGILQRR